MEGGATLPISTLPQETYSLSPPSLNSLIPPILRALEKNYSSSSCTITACPDLTAPPFNLSSPGLNGNEVIASVGTPENFYPFVDKSKKYNIPEIVEAASSDGEGMKEGRRRMATGAAAGPFHIIGQNAELIPNLTVHSSGSINNLTTYTKIDDDGQPFNNHVPGGNADCAVIADLFISDGKPGDVLKITAKGRVGEESSFTKCVRKGLGDEFGDRIVSMGGVFLVKRGKFRMHVMPNFSKTPLNQGNIEGWLKFFEMEPEMVCLTTFHSGDPGLGLRTEHTHCFGVGEGRERKGGHYHNDVEDGKEEVEYEAYLNVARKIVRIDGPSGT